MRVHHGGTEIMENSRYKTKLRALRVSMVNDFQGALTKNAF